jgi:SAM-dependent methyltransferase
MYERLAPLYDAIYAFKDYPAEATRLHELIQVRRPGARTLLDVACGTGKHLEELRRHYDVSGADSSTPMLEIARERLPGVKLHRTGMESLDLGTTFDVVTCLFSAIGHMRTISALENAIEHMAAHVAPGGVLIVEPWIAPEDYREGTVHNLSAEAPGMKIARMNVSAREGDLAVLDFHFLIGTAGGIEYLTDRHELGLFDPTAYEAAFRRADLSVERDSEGLMGRGLFIGTRPGNARRRTAAGNEPPPSRCRRRARAW